MDRRGLPALAFALVFASLILPVETSGGAIEYVIITPDNLAAEFQRLADFRTDHGVSTEVRTVEWIEANYPGGVDSAERVRLFIQDAYTTQATMSILLGGDAEVVPVRYAHMTLFGGKDILCDYYFMCLDGTWDLDGDQIFGEIEDDVDLIPEVFAGRAPVSTPAEAATFVDKTIAYEEATERGSNYPDSGLFLAERLFSSLHGAVIAEELIAMLPPSFEVDRLYEESENWPDSSPLGLEAALEAINAGYGFIFQVGHNTSTTWSLANEELTLNHVDALENGPNYSLVFSFGATAAFDLDAIGEHWLRAPEGGAVVYIGSTALSFVNHSWDYALELMRLIVEDDVLGIGLASGLARFPFIEDAQQESIARYTLFSLVTLGDPLIEFPLQSTAAIGSSNPTPPVRGLVEAVPNPFTITTRIALEVPGASREQVQLGIYDVGGRLVRHLLDGEVESGRHELSWDGRGADSPAPAGVYFLKAQIGDRTETTKLVKAF